MKISVGNVKICNQTRMGERLERIGEVWTVDETDCLDWTSSRRWREGLGAPPQIWEQYSRGRI